MSYGVSGKLYWVRRNRIPILFPAYPHMTPYPTLYWLCNEFILPSKFLLVSCNYHVLHVQHRVYLNVLIQSNGFRRCYAKFFGIKSIQMKRSIASKHLQMVNAKIMPCPFRRRSGCVVSVKLKMLRKSK